MHAPAYPRPHCRTSYAAPVPPIRPIPTQATACTRPVAHIMPPRPYAGASPNLHPSHATPAFTTASLESHCFCTLAPLKPPFLPRLVTPVVRFYIVDQTTDYTIALTAMLEQILLLSLRTLAHVFTGRRRSLRCYLPPFSAPSTQPLFLTAAANHSKPLPFLGPNPFSTTCPILSSLLADSSVSFFRFAARLTPSAHSSSILHL